MMTLILMFGLQCAIYLMFSRLVTPTSLMFGIAVVGFTFGGMLTIFPATTADFFGLKNFGVNYGMLITAWGAGGLFGPLVGGMVRDLTGTYALSYTISAAISALGILLAFVVRPPAEVYETQARPEVAG
jgi:OFA family oxalate/formate antiporter-like MFS transporter